MSEIKLVKRIKYAGDVHATLMELGWDAKTAAAFLDDIPDADAVEVVRCKDCKHRGDDLCCPMCFEEESVIDEGDGYFDTDYITHDRTVDDGFCDRGERRADE